MYNTVVEAVVQANIERKYVQNDIYADYFIFCIELLNDFWSACVIICVSFVIDDQFNGSR